MVPDAIDLSVLRRVLVVKLRHHGDVLLTSPLFTVLKNRAPQSEIDALIYRDSEALLAGHPAIAQIHTIDRAWKKQGLTAQLSAEWALLRKLLARRYDLVIHLTTHPRGAWIKFLTRARYAVAEQRENKWWRRIFTHYYILPRHTPRHTVECNLDALRRIGVYPERTEKRLVLTVSQDASARIQALLAKHRLQAKNFIQFHPGSRWLFKCWSASASAALLDRLGENWQLVLTGAPDPRETAFVNQILQETKRAVINLTGELSLTELAALTAQARLFIGVDSAPMHIAAAMQTPVVALFGPSGEQVWGPWMVPHRVVVSSQHVCRPCGLDGCGGGKVSECLTELPVERVLQAVHSVLCETESAIPAHR